MLRYTYVASPVFTFTTPLYSRSYWHFFPPIVDVLLSNKTNAAMLLISVTFKHRLFLLTYRCDWRLMLFPFLS
jgi:hypothetical protein